MKMSWVELDRIVSEEILRDDNIRRRVADSGRPLRSQATGMSDDDLLAKLCGLGVDADREKLAGLCDGALSAEEVVSERLGLRGWDADWAWICPRVGMSGQVRPVRFADPPLNTPQPPFHTPSRKDVVGRTPDGGECGPWRGPREPRTALAVPRCAVSEA